MSAPVYTSNDFLRAFQRLMPRGRVWPTEDDAVQTKVFSGLNAVYGRISSRASYLLVDSFPGTTLELLPEWEATLGLPDPCAGEAPTIQQRRAQVVARFANSGGQSAAYFIQFAANLGYTVTITNFSPARAGQSRAGQPDNGVAWAYAWRINAPLNTVVRARAGYTTAGEPLGAWGNAVLQCEITTIAPAHTVPIFSYS